VQKFNLVDFQTKFRTEKSCHEYLHNLKWPDGYRCPKCDHTDCFTINTRKLPVYECKNCRHQTTVLVGTIFEKTRTPLVKWFWAIYLVAHDKRGISANHLAGQIGVSYPTSWLMLHKIRKAMGDRDALYQLEGIVELDDAFFGAPKEGGKRGRGTEKAKVIVGLSLTPRGNPVNVKMQVVENLQRQTIIRFAEQNIMECAIIPTDLYCSYNALSERGYIHIRKKFNAKDNPDHLHWMHTVISNAKAFVGGTFHGLDKKHLQAYLDEFCYRFNRRKFKNALFYRLLTCCVQSETITYPELT